MSFVFKPEAIVYDLKSPNATEAIDEIVGRLSAAGIVPAETAGSIALAIKARESSMSTGIGFGVAVPHATTPLATEIVLAFGRSIRGVEFESLDQQPVRLIALMIVPSNEREKHLPLLARISRLLHRKETRAALEAAKDAGEIAGILNAGLAASTRV